MRQLLLCVFTVLAVSSPAAVHEERSVDVHMTASGFTPARVTIKQGDTVRFVNDDAVDRWPASDIHPTHGIYPAFDPKNGVQPGANWSFRFEEAGLWRMHDHLKPDYRGIVRVQEDADFVPAPTPGPGFLSRALDLILSPFRGFVRSARSAYFALFPSRAEATLASLDVRSLTRDEDSLKTWVRQFGGKKLMGKLLDESGGGSVEDCHKEAHVLGRLSYELFGVQAFRDGDAACHSGFYHGAMESMLREKGTADLSGTLKTVCDLFPTGFSRFSCLHGVGHGVLAYADYDLPSALDTCRSLPTSYDQTSCFGGAFMENIVAGQGNAAVTGHATTWVNDIDLLYPCNAIDQEYDVQYQCYQMQTSWMLTQRKYDFRTVADACLGAPEQMVRVCFRSLGRDAAGHTLRSVPKILDICALVPDAHYTQCIEGALNVIVDFSGDRLRDQATDLCRAVSRVDAKERCYSVLRSRLTDTVPDSATRKDICAKFEETYRNCDGL